MTTEDDVKKLYDAMLRDGYNDLGSEEEFRNRLKDRGNIAKLYGALKRDGYNDLGSEDEFGRRLGYVDQLESIENDIANERGKQSGAAVSAVNTAVSDGNSGGYAGMIQAAAERAKARGQQPGPVQTGRKQTAGAAIESRGNGQSARTGQISQQPMTAAEIRDSMRPVNYVEQMRRDSLAREKQEREAKAGTLGETHYRMPGSVEAYAPTEENRQKIEEEKQKAYTPSEETQRSMERENQMRSRMQTAYLKRRSQNEAAMEQAFADAEDIKDSEALLESTWANMDAQERESMIGEMVDAIKETNPLQEGQQWDEGKLREYGEEMAKQSLAQWMGNYAGKSKSYTAKMATADKDATRVQTKELAQQVKTALDKRGMELDQEAMNDPWGDRPRGGGALVHTTNSSTANGRFTDMRWKQLYAANNALSKAERLFREAEIKKQGGIHDNFATTLVRGMDKVGNPRSWDMGLSDGVEADALRTALLKADKGKELTESEQMLLDAKAIELAAQMYTESDISGWFKAGEVTADALPFMLEMMINPASKVGESVQSMLTRYAIKRFSNNAMKKGTRKLIQRGIGYGGRALTDAAAATYMAATTGSMRTLASATERLNGDIQTSTDAEGRTHYAGHKVDEDMTDRKAFWEGFGSTAIEQHSEMIGEYFAPLMAFAGKGLGKVANSKFGKALRLDNVADFFSDVKLSDRYKLWNDFMKETKWAGTIGEYAEEVVGGIENAIMVGDQTLDTDPETGVFNLEQNLETLRGVAVMGVGMSAMQTFGYRTPKQKARKAMRAADTYAQQVFGDRWGDIKDLIANNIDSKELPKQMAEQMAGMSSQEKRAVLDYYTATYQYQGADYGTYAGATT